LGCRASLSRVRHRPKSAVILGAMSRVTKRIRLGPAVSVLTFHNPLLVAEEYAMVDLLTDGRLNFGAGSGYLRHEFEHFRVSLDEKRERAEEALRVVLQAWMGESLFTSAAATSKWTELS
jgi:alkanesulfonate monooxygenase SsuD/methylene tetrahydromethanopterin reductase-like flavin-dependent oxidoreductase (luciferase family)